MFRTKVRIYSSFLSDITFSVFLISDMSTNFLRSSYNLYDFRIINTHMRFVIPLDCNLA